jgi:hypothetical protein
MDFQPEYYEVLISKENFEKLREDHELATILNLARVVNALYFCYNSFLDYTDDTTPAGTRQNINAFLFMAGVLHDGLTVADRLEKHFGDLESYKNGFGKLLSEATTNQTRSTIKDMRDKFVFHYDKDVAWKTIKTLDLDSYLFSTSIGTKRSGMYYKLADDIVINYLLGKCASREEEEHKLREIFESVSELSASYTIAADTLIGDVISKGNWKLRKGINSTS